LNWRSLDEFLALISADLRNLRPVDSKDAARTVFAVLNDSINPGQVEKVREALPIEVRQLWPVSNAPGTRGIESAA
jgi:uncharacterized protein (DUF2267 family)